MTKAKARFKEKWITSTITRNFNSTTTIPAWLVHNYFQLKRVDKLCWRFEKGRVIVSKD